MEAITFLQDLAVVLIAAGLVTVIFRRFRQPIVLGYILAGFLVGPHTTPFPLIQHEESIRTLAELGIILLLFSLGLDFNLRKLKRVGAGASIAALLEIVLMLWVGFEIGQVFGWSRMDSLFLGAMLSISSTTIIIKAISELGKTKETFAQLIFGILIIEDILAIAMIGLLSSIAMAGSLSAADVGLTLGKLVIFLVAVVVLGLLIVPRLLDYIARLKSDEVLLIAVLGLCFGFALLASRFGYSVALGAFVIGAIISECRQIGRVVILTGPVRDMFSAVFFIAIGLMIRPGALVEHAWPIVVITLVVVVGKILACSLGTYVAGYDTRTSLRVGMGLAQIGEFSFIIAALGLSLQVTSDFLYPVAVAVSALTTLLTPYLIQSADRMVNWFDQLAPAPLRTLLRIYTEWVGRLGMRQTHGGAANLARKWVLQMGLNMALIAAVFIAAAFMAEAQPDWLPVSLVGERNIRATLWLGAAVLSLPLFIATFRKLQALGLLVAQAKVPWARAGERTPGIRTVVAQVIPLAGTIAMALWALLLSSAFLPPWNVLLLLLLIVATITWLLWRSFVRIYSKAQVALRETLSHVPASNEIETRPLPGPLKNAQLATIFITAEAAAAGKLIRELQVRSRTGASIVGIERDGGSIVNPGADEELQAGDELLLLGTHAQLEAARELLLNA